MIVNLVQNRSSHLKRRLLRQTVQTSVETITHNLLKRDREKGIPIYQITIPKIMVKAACVGMNFP
jgi:hypothetical protein